MICNDKDVAELFLMHSPRLIKVVIKFYDRFFS